MKRPHLPLYGQILLWFFLNLALVAAVLFVVLRVQFQLDLGEILTGRTGDQFKAAAEVMSSDLRRVSSDDWEEILSRYNEAYGVSFGVYHPRDGRILAGEEIELPKSLVGTLEREFPAPRGRGGPPSRSEERREGGRRGLPENEPFLREDEEERPREGRGPRGEGRGPFGGDDRNPRDDRGGFRIDDRSPPFPRRDQDGREGRGGGRLRDDRPPPRDLPDENRSEGGSRPIEVFYVGKGGSPSRHWAAAMVSVASHEYRHPPDVVIAASSPTLSGNRVFFDWRPWMWAMVVILLVSALIWLPFVGRMTRRLSRLTSAAESISKGQFEVEVATDRGDELGRLSRAVQRMAQRLDDYMAGQKRFLGDIAHELCSPLARLRMAVGVLESKIPEEDHGNLATLHEEAEELSHLINELLDFSRASIAPANLPQHDVGLKALLEEVAQREGQGAVFRIEAAPDLHLTTNRDLLRRALGNVVRNANRYAGEAGPITLKAEPRGDGLSICVEDEGPGIAEEWLEKVFEPFSRPERARTREGGGAGLGLAIAKTCVEGLGGEINARNRRSGGLIVELLFRTKVNGGEG